MRRIKTRQIIFILILASRSCAHAVVRNVNAKSCSFRLNKSKKIVIYSKFNGELILDAKCWVQMNIQFITYFHQSKSQ